MTCIVGVVHVGRAWVGGDSAGSGGNTTTIRADAKIFANGPFLFGFTSSFRMGQLLRYALVPPPPPSDPAVLDRFMSTTFVDAVRAALKDGGYASKSSEQESGGCFLVALGGRLWSVQSDYQVAAPADGYASVGSGAEVALGALHATVGRGPEERIGAALAAAAYHTSYVRAPFVVLPAPGETAPTPELRRERIEEG